ncbi:MAG: hypothetical protein JZU55_21490, partial [Afipia sp.]|nr:hypothetical protein [Afipia sp.]
MNEAPGANGLSSPSAMACARMMEGAAGGPHSVNGSAARPMRGDARIAVERAVTNVRRFNMETSWILQGMPASKRQ